MLENITRNEGHIQIHIAKAHTFSVHTATSGYHKFPAYGTIGCEVIELKSVVIGTALSVLKSILYIVIRAAIKYEYKRCTHSHARRTTQTM